MSTEARFSQQIGETLRRHERARQELENKEKFFVDYRATQRIAEGELIDVFRSIQTKFQSLIERFDRVMSLLLPPSDVERVKTDVC